MSNRILILMRHAKSSWSDLSAGDLGRPLNDRGMRDAPLMADEYSKRYKKPDSLLVSPAKRTRMTAAYFKDKFEIDKQNISFKEVIYQASPQDMIDLIQEQDAGHQTIMLIGHNPTMTTLIETISSGKIDQVPTAGMAIISYQGEDWLGFNEQTCHFEAFYYPKQFLKK